MTKVAAAAALGAASLAILYAQFQGDEVDGKVYDLGEPLADTVDGGTRAYLESTGRFAATNPGTVISVPSADKPLEEMNRAELEATARSMVDLSSLSDDDLRGKLAQMRAAQGEEDEDADLSRADAITDEDRAAYEAIKEKPVDQLKTAELELVAKVEGVDLAEAKNNGDRATAIETARNA